MATEAAALIGGPGLESIAAGWSVAPARERPAKEAEGVLEARALMPRRAVAKFSDTTATYARFGPFPALHLFQIARPQPEARPLGQLVKEVPPSGQGVFTRSYARSRSAAASASSLIDNRA